MKWQYIIFEKEERERERERERGGGRSLYTRRYKSTVKFAQCCQFGTKSTLINKCMHDIIISHSFCNKLNININGHQH